MDYYIAFIILAIIITTYQITKNHYRHIDKSRQLWIAHIWLTRDYIMTTDKLQAAIAAQLMKNQEDIGAFYHSPELTTLLKEHIALAAEIIKSQETSTIKKWFDNANQISDLVEHKMHKNIRAHMIEHLDLTLKEAGEIKSGKYAESFATFDQLMKCILKMSDILTCY